MSRYRIWALVLPAFLLGAVCWAIAWQLNLNIPFGADDGPVEWLDTALLALLSAVTFGIGLFQLRRARAVWWSAALGLGLVMVLSLGDFFPGLLPDIDNSDYPMLGGWAAAAAILLILGRSEVGSGWVRIAAIGGFALHSVAMIFDLLDQWLLSRLPRMAAGFGAAREIVELFYLATYCCVALIIVWRVTMQALSDPAARRVRLTVPAGLERRIGRWFKLPAGRKLRIAVEDARWRAWQAEHPGRGFADYYAEQIGYSLAAGQPHRTLGSASYSDHSLFSGGRRWTREAFARRGLGKYQPLLDWGLRPDERVIDYGCGSLRIGQHLIRYLDRGNYTGLDVTDVFYRQGLQMLEAGLVEAKAPHLAVIDEALLERLSHCPPDVIVSVAVVMHVPPDELPLFFRRLLQLAGPATRIMIHADIASRELRTAPKSWAYPAAHYRQLIAGLRPDLRFAVQLQHRKGRIDGVEWRHGIITLTPAAAS